MFEMHYTGIGYPSMSEIEADGKTRGAKYSYWASECGYVAMYNGDTVVLYDDIENVPENYVEDAIKYGKLIK